VAVTHSDLVTPSLRHFVTSRAGARGRAPFVLPSAPSNPPCDVMEINQLRRSLEDLTERSEALRRFL
jgi:hypothetical protein